MRRVLSFSVLLVQVLWVAHAVGQASSSYLQATGNPSFSTNIPIPNGYIDLGNGNLHLEIPIAQKKQRGALNVNEELVYDSRIWEIVHYSGYYWWPLNVPNSMDGWRFVRGNETGSMYLNQVTEYDEACPGDPGYLPYDGDTTDVNSITWIAPDGTNHLFDAMQYVEITQCGQDATTLFGGYAVDASGYQVAGDASGNPIVYDVAGNEVYPAVVDRFGNYLSTDANGDLVDDAGLTPVQTTTNGNVTYYDVLSPNGTYDNNTRVRYTVTTEQVQLSTAFDQSGVTEYQNNNGESPTITTIQSIGLPDGSSYSFQYDSYGEITTMTLPTGGQVLFGWSNYTDSYQNVNRWVTTSAMDGYTTYYSPSVISQCSSNGTGCQEQVSLVKPSGDETDYTFTLNNGAWDTTTAIYSGSASSGIELMTDTPSYTFTNSCTYTLVCGGAEYISKASDLQVLADTGQQAQTQYTYSNPDSGQTTGISQWDYFTGTAPTTPTRQINYVYTQGLLESEIHYDQNSNIASQTTYNYGTTATATSGIAGHETNPDPLYPNTLYLASVQKVSNYPSRTVSTSYLFDDTGALLSLQDADLHPATTFKYDPSNTYIVEIDKPDTTTNGVPYHHVTKSSYDANSGMVLSTDDENSVANGQAYTVQYTYESTAGRVQSISIPSNTNLLSESFSYPSPNEVDKTVGAVMTAYTIDGYGRSSKISSGGISTEDGYDSNGRLYTVTNPHTSTSQPTDGTTTTTYDTLDRTLTVQNPDGTSQSNIYRGNVVYAYDELHQEKQYTYDAFNNLESVTEPDPSTGTPDLITNYVRDGLGNIICVEQHGNTTGTGCSSSATSDPSSSWRVRRYFYNSNSQLIAAEIPEHFSEPSNPPSQACGLSTSTWTDCYSYDAAGNLASITDNSSAVRSLSYDYLNRAISETSPTLANTLAYDASTNGVGHLYSQSNGSNAASTYAYDGLGRTTAEMSCRPSTCGTSTWMGTSVQYDANGNVQSVTYPDRRVITNTYDSANRPSSVTYSSWNGQSTGASYWSNPSYTPTGALLSAQYGNTAVSMEAAYNSRQSITSLSYATASATYFEKTYGWAANAQNLTSETNVLNGQIREFSYDHLNRLVSAVDTTGGTQSTATITIGGSDHSEEICPPKPDVEEQRGTVSPDSLPGGCIIHVDTGVVSVTVAGFTANYSYNGASTIAEIISSFVLQLNNSNLVTATSSGDIITITSIGVGPTMDYSLSHSNGSDFTVSTSGTTMTGGTYNLANGGLNQQYTLDAWGNLSSMGSSGFSQLINEQNQVEGFAYDAVGRVHSDSLTYTYDDNGMLISSSDGTSYSYDAAEQRSTVGNIDYYYFKGRLIATEDTSADIWTDLVYANGSKLAQVIGNQSALPTFTLTDHIGSEVATVDASGNLLSSVDYSPFGQVLIGTLSDPYFFAGLQRDGSGLDHAMARQYSSAAGRWTVADPYDRSYDPTNPQSMNRYEYTGNPLEFVDPLGLQTANCPDCAATFYMQGAGAAECDIWCKLAVDLADGLANLFSFGTRVKFKGSVNANRNGKNVQNAQKNPNSQECQELLNNINNVASEIYDRIDEYNADLWKIPLYGTMSRQGHITQMAQKQVHLNRLLTKYQNECGDPPDNGMNAATQPLPALTPSQSTKTPPWEVVPLGISAGEAEGIEIGIGILAF